MADNRLIHNRLHMIEDRLADDRLIDDGQMIDEWVRDDRW